MTPFDSRHQLYFPPGALALPQGTIHVASLLLRMYWPLKTQSFFFNQATSVILIPAALQHLLLHSEPGKPLENLEL